MKSILRFACVLLLSLPLISSCSKVQSKTNEPPSVSLADIELDGIKGLETIFRLQLRVINPDEEPLEIHSLRCTLKVQGKPFAQGISGRKVTVPASDTATVPVLVYAGMIDMVSSVIDLLQHNAPLSGGSVKPLKYELTGNLRLGETGQDSVPFELTGSLPPEQ